MIDSRSCEELELDSSEPELLDSTLESEDPLSLDAEGSGSPVLHDQRRTELRSLALHNSALMFSESPGDRVTVASTVASPEPCKSGTEYAPAELPLPPLTACRSMFAQALSLPLE